jgi:hypothetical protein
MDTLLAQENVIDNDFFERYALTKKTLADETEKWESIYKQYEDLKAEKDAKN